MLKSCHVLLPHWSSQKPTNSNFANGSPPSGHRSRSPYGVRLC